MATVRITQSIIDHVQNRIRGMFRTRLDEMNKKINAIAPRIVNEAWEYSFTKAQKDAAYALGDDWVHVADSARAQIHFKITDDADAERSSFLVDASFPVRRPLPKGFANYYRYLSLPEHAPVYESAVKLMREYRAIERERDELLDNIVNGFLKQCTTLRQVLEKWPGALEFMPSEAIAKHNTKTERVETAIPEVEDKVKTALIKARMLSNS